MEDQKQPEGRIFSVTREVPEAEGRTVTLALNADHSIVVERDAAWSGFHESPAETYEWLGGVPNPEDPQIPDDGKYGKTKAAYADPVTAVMAAVVRSHRPNRQQKQAAQDLWAEMWRELAGHLEPRAAGLAYNYGYTADLYKILVARPDLCDHIEVAPALGPFMTAERSQAVPQSGWELKKIAEYIISPDADNPLKLSPGFMVWAQQITWDQTRLPMFPRNRKDRFVAMRGLVLSAARLGEAIDPNGIYKLETDDEWLLVNQAITSPSAPHLVPGILANPETAVKRVNEHFPPNLKVLRLGDGSEIRLDRRGKIVRALDAVEEYRQANLEEASRLDSFGGMAKRARKWDQKMWHAEVKQAEGFDALEAEKNRRAEAARAAYEAERARLRRMGMENRTLPAGLELDTEFAGLPPAEDRVYEDERYRMILLSTPEDLLVEGNIAGHCVGGNWYIQGCAEGRIHILSVRDKTAEAKAHEREEEPPRPVATIEVTANTFAVRQQYGPGNRALPEQIRAWIGDAKEHIRANIRRHQQAERARRIRAQ